MLCRVHDRVGVLDRHRPTGERDHFALNVFFLVGDERREGERVERKGKKRKRKRTFNFALHVSLFFSFGRSLYFSSTPLRPFGKEKEKKKEKREERGVVVEVFASRRKKNHARKALSFEFFRPLSLRSRPLSLFSCSDVDFSKSYIACANAFEHYSRFSAETQQGKLT